LIAVSQLATYDVVFVGVRYALEELRRHERKRGDCGSGRAKAQYPVVHALVEARGGYDLEVDTTSAQPEACAFQIRQYTAAG